MTIKKICTAVLFSAVLAAPVLAQEADAPAGPRNKVLEIEQMEAKLDSIFAILTGEGVAAASGIYGQAKGRLREAGNLVSLKPKSKEAVMAFAICSISAAGALMQLEREVNLAEVRKKNAKRDSLLSRLHDLHEAINRIEGSRANRLSQDLQATKAKAAAIEGDLEAEQARAAQLKQNLEAELQRARKEREEAQNKLNALQSSVIQVSRDARGTIITMADILFETGKADLKPTLRENLATIAGILIAYKDPKILIEGHTDNVGGEAFNQKLSEDRAQNVLNFLVERGVGAERLTSNGHGFNKPIADNATAEGRAKNRRVDLIVQDNLEGDDK